MSDKKIKGITNIFVDTEELNAPATQEGQEFSIEKRLLFFERFQYIPVYIIGLLLYWVIASVLENFLNDDDIVVYAFIPSLVIVSIVVALKSKIKNKWVFHTLLALFGAPLWMLLLTPFVLMYVGFVLL